MKSENLAKAFDSICFTVDELKAAHKDASLSENQFAQIVVFQLLTEAIELKTKIQEAKDAAQ